MLATSVSGLFCISVSASALGGALGMASGIFVVPILTIIAGVDVRVGIGASLVSVIACSCGSASPFLKLRLTNVRLAIVLETATTLGAASGLLLSGVVPVPALYAIFATALFVSAWQIRGPVTAASPPGRPTRRWLHRLNSAYPDGAALLSALLGIGSGVLKILAMDTALRLPIKVSSETSNFMKGVTAAASAGAYFMRGAIVPEIAGPVALGSVVGAILGAHLAADRSQNMR